jgi:hypothetical protein
MIEGNPLLTDQLVNPHPRDLQLLGKIINSQECFHLILKEVARPKGPLVYQSNERPMVILVSSQPRGVNLKLHLNLALYLQTFPLACVPSIPIICCDMLCSRLICLPFPLNSVNKYGQLAFSLTSQLPQSTSLKIYLSIKWLPLVDQSTMTSQHRLLTTPPLRGSQRSTKFRSVHQDSHL